jgi:hypothetical protein
VEVAPVVVTVVMTVVATAKATPTTSRSEGSFLPCYRLCVRVVAVVGYT